MRFGRATRVSALTAAALIVLSVAALAGKAYMEARKKIRRGDPEGLAQMEKVCKKEPFASNAFLDLAKGYLRIKKDAAMAMDAAVRGLEQYSEKWQFKVSKKSLYDVFSQAAAQAKPEDLRKYLPRVEKLAERDGDLAKPILTRYAQHLPTQAVRTLLARGKAAEAGKNIGAALKAYTGALKSAADGGVESQMATELAPAKALTDAAAKEYAAGEELAAAKKYAECFKALEDVSRKYAGAEIARKATERLKALKASPEVAAARAEIEQKARETEAAALLEAARKLVAEKDYVKAAEGFKRVKASFADTPAATEAEAELKKLEADPEAQRAVKNAAAERECRSLLGMARTFKMNGMTDKARAKLDEVIRKYPGTDWARQAAKMKSGL